MRAKKYLTLQFLISNKSWGGGRTVLEALAAIGRDDEGRRELLEALSRVERHLARPEFSVRNEVTGPLIDALHRDTGSLLLTLQQGVRFHYQYQGNIHRELAMAQTEMPDHVWEPQTTRLLLLLAKEAQNILIGGAYSGDHALLLAQAVGLNGTVYCFEPNIAESEQLAFNADDNGLTNIRIEQRGLWSLDEVYLRLTKTPDESCASAQVINNPDEDSFPATTIATYARSQGIETLDLIMLDIEGGEHEALRGAAPYLDMPAGQAPDVVFEVHRQYVDWSAGLHNTHIVQELINRGYTVFAVRDFQGHWPMGESPIELVSPEDAYLEGPPHGFNMAAVKNEARLLGSEFRVCKGVSPKYLRHRDPALHAPLEA